MKLARRTIARLVGLLSLVGALTVAVAWGAFPASARPVITAAVVRAAAGPVALAATIDSRQIANSTDSRPVRLDPRKPAELEVAVVNNGSSPVTVKTVRLEGRVMGLAFFAYDTSVGLTVAPGGQETRRLVLDLTGLRDQATGLMRGRIQLLDPDRKVLAAQNLIVDVRGSLKSVYGIFGLIVIGMTILALVRALIALARNRLPFNRWQRGLRFLPAGTGFGLTIVFTLSALRVWAPGPARWIPILLVGSLGAFVLGYLTPNPHEDDSGPVVIVADEETLAVATQTLGSGLGGGVRYEPAGPGPVPSPAAQTRPAQAETPVPPYGEPAPPAQFPTQPHAAPPTVQAGGSGAEYPPDPPRSS